MSDMKDIYNLCKFVDSDNYQENEYYDDERKKEKVEREDKEVVELCIKEYSDYTKAKRFRKALSKSKVAKIYNNAISKNYLGNFSDGKNVSVDLTDKGMRLTSTKWHFRKVGLREETMNEYPQTREMYKIRYQAYIATTSGIIGTAVGSAITYYLTTLR